MAIKGFTWPDKAFDDSLEGGEGSKVPSGGKGARKTGCPPEMRGLLEKLRQAGAAFQGQVWDRVLGPPYL